MVGLRSYLLACAAGSVTLGAGLATGVAAAIVRMVANANEGVLGGDLLSLIRRYAALRAGAVAHRRDAGRQPRVEHDPELHREPPARHAAARR